MVIYMDIFSLFTMLGSKPSKTLSLDERQWAKPALSLVQAQTVSENIVRDILTLSTYVGNLPVYYSKGSRKTVKAESAKIHDKLEKLEEYLMLILDTPLSTGEIYTANQLLQSIEELNEITNHLLHIAELSKSISRLKQPLSLAALKDLRELWNRIDTILQKLEEAFLKGNYITSMWMKRQNSIIQEQIKELKKNHIKRLRNGTCSVETGMFFLDLLNNCEQIANHCTNLFDEAFIMDSTEERKG